MGEQPPRPPTTQDFPDHWGFYLLQAINRLNDKIDDVRHRHERTAEALRQEIGGVRQEIHVLDIEFGQKIGALDAKFGQQIAALDTKFDHKLTNLQYWYWSTLIVIIVGFVTVLFTHP